MTFRAPHAFRDIISIKNLAGLQTSSGLSNSSGSPALWTVSTTAVASVQYFSFSFTFALSDLVNMSQYTTLFDMYRIDRVVVKVFPIANFVSQESTQSAVQSATGGWLHWAQDYDDATLPTASDVGIDSLRQHKAYKMCNIHKSSCLTQRIRPRMAMAAYGTGAFTSYTNVKPNWIDSNSPGVAHYGLKGIFEIVNPAAAANFVNFKLEVTYFFRTKEPI